MEGEIAGHGLGKVVWLVLAVDVPARERVSVARGLCRCRGSASMLNLLRIWLRGSAVRVERNVVLSRDPHGLEREVARDGSIKHVSIGARLTLYVPADEHPPLLCGVARARRPRSVCDSLRGRCRSAASGVKRHAKGLLRPLGIERHIACNSVAGKVPGSAAGSVLKPSAKVVSGERGLLLRFIDLGSIGLRL